MNLKKNAYETKSQRHKGNTLIYSELYFKMNLLILFINLIF